MFSFAQTKQWNHPSFSFSYLTSSQYQKQFCSWFHLQNKSGRDHSYISSLSYLEDFESLDFLLPSQPEMLPKLMQLLSVSADRCQTMSFSSVSDVVPYSPLAVFLLFQSRAQVLRMAYRTPARAETLPTPDSTHTLYLSTSFLLLKNTAHSTFWVTQSKATNVTSFPAAVSPVPVSVAPKWHVCLWIVSLGHFPQTYRFCEDRDFIL